MNDVLFGFTAFTFYVSKKQLAQEEVCKKGVEVLCLLC
jgi:hypothetical protein